MEEVERIRLFLRAVRRRALLTAGLQAGGFTSAAILLALLVLASFAVRVGPATFWPSVTVGVLLILTLVGLGLGCIGPLRRLRSEREVARYVGRQYPPLASDLLSAVELAVPAGQPIPHGGSHTIAHAFQAMVAEAVRPLEPRRLVPMVGVRRGAGTLGGALVLLVLGLAFAPSLRKGFGLLTRHPTRFEGAAVSTEPLIGDVRLTYIYPSYTGLPKRVIEGSTGDVVGLKGTQVLLEMRALRSTRQAMLLLGETGEAGELPVKVNSGWLNASLMLRESMSYRMWLSPLLGRPVREARAHRVVVEADRAPEVEIIGPADRLELPTPRPIEIAYAARDDFGLGSIDLVYRIDDGTEQRIPLRTPEGARSSQGKTVFEPAAATLGPGARVAYRIEAKDRDAVSGAKAGSSRTLYLIIQNPRENLDEQLAREREILDRLLGTLGDRLELGQEPASPRPNASSSDLVSQLARWVGVHDGEESHLALLGRMVDEERRAGAVSKALLAALAGIADKLGKHLRDETASLAALRARADVGQLAVGGLMRLQAADTRHVVELESAVLLLDDLIGRQRLEDLAALGRDLTNSYKRLQDLLARYNATKDEAVRRQLEREIRDLRARLQELARKIAEVKARNEVPAEWQNMPDMKEALQKAEKLDALLEKGDAASMSQALSELGKELEALQKSLDKNADDFGGERFSQENRAATELMKKLSDLEGDQRGVAGDSQSLAGEVDSEMARKMKGQSDELVAKAKEKLEALRKKLAGAPPREAGETGGEELQRAQESVKQMKRLLSGKEFGEAKKEAERTGGSLKRLRRALDDRNATRRTPSPAMEQFQGEMGEASKIAQDLQADLEKLVPQPQDSMSPGQKERSKGLGQRQGSLEERAQQLAEEMNKRSSMVPGADKAGGELKQIGQQMGEASGDLDRPSPHEGAGKAQDAAERLAKLRDQMGKRQMGSSQNQREPVRIPGADESKAPREWRQELLEAMRERAPDRFREEVRRYYEELVK
jgi:hypothetical protein